MALVAERVAAVIGEAGYGPREPVVVGLQRNTQPPVFVARGVTKARRAPSADSVFYAASVSKQITAGCVALLVRDGALDMEDPVARHIPGLPEWAQNVRLRHLLHHTAAMPDREIDAMVGDEDRTSAAVLAALARTPAPGGRPGAAPGVVYAYSSAGYVLLAAAVERAAGRPLPAFTAERIFRPLGMRSTRLWPGPEPAPPGAVPLAAPHPAPLSLGDGGVWSTADDLLRWSQALNSDELGISELMQTPGRLDDGTPLDYAWGMGVRSYAGYRVYRHGGGWPGLRALLARVPDLNLSIVIAALADDSERRVDLAAALLEIAVQP